MSFYLHFCVIQCPSSCESRVKGYRVCFARRGWRFSGTAVTSYLPGWMIIKVFCIVIVGVCMCSARRGCPYKTDAYICWKPALHYYSLSGIGIMTMVIMIIMVMCVVEGKLIGMFALLSAVVASVVFVFDSGYGAGGGLCSS